MAVAVTEARRTDNHMGATEVTVAVDTVNLKGATASHRVTASMEETMVLLSIITSKHTSTSSRAMTNLTNPTNPTNPEVILCRITDGHKLSLMPSPSSRPLLPQQYRHGRCT